MKIRFLIASALLTGACATAFAQAAPKIGIIHIQNAILSTKDGQKAATELQTRFSGKKVEIDRKQSDIVALQDQLKKGSNTMNDDARQKLMREIDQKTTSLNRDTEDAQAEVNQEEGKIMQELGGRLMSVLDKYAKDNGYVLVLDVSNPQTNVLFAANGLDITNDIVALYDKNAPAPAAAKPPVTTSAPPRTTPAAAPAAPPPAAKRPAAAKP